MWKRDCFKNVRRSFSSKTSWDPSYILILVLVIQIVCCSHKLINKSRLLLRHSTWHVGILNMRGRRCKGYTYMYCMALIKNSFQDFRFRTSKLAAVIRTRTVFFFLLIRVSILHRAHSIQSLSKCAYYVRAVNMEKEVDIFLIIPLTGQCHRSLRSLGPANNHYNYIIYNICLYASLALPMRHIISSSPAKQQSRTS